MFKDTIVRFHEIILLHMITSGNELVDPGSVNLTDQNFSISCSFMEKFANSLLGKNKGSAPGMGIVDNYWLQKESFAELDKFPCIA